MNCLIILDVYCFHSNIFLFVIISLQKRCPVVNRRQKEGVAGDGLSGIRTGARGDEFTDGLDTALAPAHFKQRAHYRAHHIAQEAVGADAEHPIVLSGSESRYTPARALLPDGFEDG